MVDEIIDASKLADIIRYDAAEGNFGTFCVIRLIYCNEMGGMEDEDEYVFAAGEHEENDQLKQKFVVGIFDNSLKYCITKAFRRRQDIKPKSQLNDVFKHGYYILGYRIYLEKTDNGQTNIEPELTDVVWGIFSKKAGET